MERLAVQNGKRKSGEIMIGERCPSDHCVKKPVTSKTVAAGAGARNWSSGPVMEKFVAIVD
jgi:hypothetical protein